MKLFKLSEPGWTKEFDTDVELQQELFMWMCEQCQCEEAITEISSINDMLATACGCDFGVGLE